MPGGHGVTRGSRRVRVGSPHGTLLGVVVMPVAELVDHLGDGHGEEDRVGDAAQSAMVHTKERM
jgi:hypothetical protein